MKYLGEVKNAWSYTSAPPYVFMAWCFTKHRDFTLMATCVCKIPSPKRNFQITPPYLLEFQFSQRLLGYNRVVW
jgi:hypothetical protein